MQPAIDSLKQCPECKTAFHASLFEQHLRQAHDIYLFEGKKVTPAELRNHLLEAIVRPNPDRPSWQLLDTIAAEEQGARADSFLAGILGQHLNRLGRDRSRQVIGPLGKMLGQEHAGVVAAFLASEGELAARQLALIIITHLPLPLDSHLFQPLRSLLLDRRLSARSQVNAAAAMLQSMGDGGPETIELLNTLVGGLSRPRAIEQLRRLEKRLGPSPIIETFCSQLEEHLKMSCPRCDVALRRPEMIQHLWDEHRLVLEGRRVREPWPLIEEWLDQLKETSNPDLLHKSEELARKLEPDGGPARVRRLLTARGLAEPQTRDELLQEAEALHASCCPRCFGLVSVPREAPPLQLSVDRGLLSGAGYQVQVRERGLSTHLEVRTARQVLHNDAEPEQYFTPGGALLVGAGPVVALAVVWACIGPAPLRSVMTILAVALMLGVLFRVLWRPSADLTTRARRYAWSLLAPHLHDRGFSVEESAFLAGLAQASQGDGLAEDRQEVLPPLLKHTEIACTRRQGASWHLALLRRLAIDDAVARGMDPIPLLLDQLARCLQGKLPLGLADLLLVNLSSSWWTPACRERVRILVLERAFEMGLEVRSLIHAGEKAPALGALLRTREEKGLASLRLLWSQRASRPWDRCGEVQTAFDVAANPAQEDLLRDHPDLLLYQEEPSWPTVAAEGEEAKRVRICLALRGVFLQGSLIEEKPTAVEVKTAGDWQMLVLGPHRFYSRGDLDELMLRLERWLRIAFSELLPVVPTVLTWKAPQSSAQLRSWGAQACPECQRPLLPVPGKVAIALEEDELSKDGPPPS